MLSAFLKKLLFARQLFMTDGRIEILGKNQIMLPSDIVVAFQSLNEQGYYRLVKNGIHSNLAAYAKKVGATNEGMMKVTEDIFETFGMGKPEIAVLDQKKKSAVVRFRNPPVAEACAENKFKDCVLLPAALAGMFSFLFNKDVNVDVTKCNIKGSVCEYVVK
jgi:predicted hydrocarbon binding protein